MNMSVVLETKFREVPVRIFCINEGPYAGKFRAVILALGIQTSIQETIGTALDRAIVNINKSLGC